MGRKKQVAVIDDGKIRQVKFNSDDIDLLLKFNINKHDIIEAFFGDLEKMEEIHEQMLEYQKEFVKEIEEIAENVDIDLDRVQDIINKSPSDQILSELVKCDRRNIYSMRRSSLYSASKNAETTKPFSTNVLKRLTALHIFLEKEIMKKYNLES
ncbi:hypothetical protein [Listeria welshimeri]|uniref:hypothetical protein n=1 Tax=Listeria welshimeri TaxID=1643 RepID=UPI00162A109E|nr:hypothetical protein [Listeria welshimeri]MBC1342368.1 hypothetical protein [Listeria welshimeri]MBC1350718.1 hypothetical protein [Listeria welshimeri]MBC1705812.1 hypothetical protein [Listeria welshimeri]MBF2342574.1 hypothetical protein [Listeria welshimeri]